MGQLSDTGQLSDKLAEICSTTRSEVERRKAITHLSAMDLLTRSAGPVRAFRAALSRKAAAGGIGLITEIKKASPSAGVIRPDFHPAAIAAAYARGGATCLSVLTDEPYFQGKDSYLREAREACSLPALRKDFMLDPWQIAESRAIGADCVLLIMAVLDDVAAAELASAARHYGMDALVEVHDADELERASRLETGLIGINNRNLRSLQTDLSVTEELAPLAAPDTLLVCESGIRTAADIARMTSAGPRCFLVGESLMRQSDVEVATRALLMGSDSRSPADPATE